MIFLCAVYTFTCKTFGNTLFRANITPLLFRRALGELLAAGSLLSSNLKLDGTLIVQVQGQGVLKMLVVEATSEHTVRATARYDETAQIADDTDLTTLLGENSVFVLTVQPKEGERGKALCHWKAAKFPIF